MSESPQADVAPARFQLEEHVGEVVLCAQAPSVAGVFEQMAHALVSVQAEALDGTVRGQPERLEVRAPDLEALLVEFLNELIYRSETRGRIFDCAHVDELDGRHLVATIVGLPPLVPGAVVKAATYHQVQVVREAGQVTARVLIDV